MGEKPRGLFIAKDNPFNGRTEYRSRRSGVTYSVGEDLSEYACYGFSVESPELVILTNTRERALSLIELADGFHTG